MGNTETVKRFLTTILLLMVVVLLSSYFHITKKSVTTSKGPTTVTDHRNLSERRVDLFNIASDLDAPWGFAWLPNGDLLITERFGQLQLISQEQDQRFEVKGIPSVFSAGQGGLLDISVHPKFSENQWIYLSYAHGTQEENRLRVARAKLHGTELSTLNVIFEVAQTKSGASHYGSRLLWLPDDTLVISVGDGGNPPNSYNGELIRNQAQALNAHLGKVIRVKDDGSIPEDNPFAGRPDVRHEIWSYGHRNPQGLTYDSYHERIIVSEHGSKGGDELNVSKPGNNYGWPLTTYSTEYDALGTAISDKTSLLGMEDPIAVWTPSVAPSGIVHYTGDQYGSWQGDLFLAAMLLRSNKTIAAYATNPAGAVLRLSTNKAGIITEQERLNVGSYRVRDIDQGPDGYLYVLTDATGRQNRPGRSAGALWRIKRPSLSPSNMDLSH